MTARRTQFFWPALYISVANIWCLPRSESCRFGFWWPTFDAERMRGESTRRSTASLEKNAVFKKLFNPTCCVPYDILHR